MTTPEIIKKLKWMKFKTFLYNNKKHYVQDFSVDEKAKKFIIFTNLDSFERSFAIAAVVFSSFEEYTETVVEKSLPEKIKHETKTFHTPSSVIVYCSYEYDRFKMLTGNRKLNKNKINKILKEIAAGNNMLKYYPLQVRERDDDLFILDGQHRFHIAEKLKEPVYYILVEEEKSMPDIAKVNSNVEKWKPADFINCYIEAGNMNYTKIEKFLDDYKISLSVSLCLLGKGHPGTESYTSTEDFENGIFEVKHLAEAEEIADLCMVFKQFANWRSRGFVIAIFKIFKANKLSIAEVYNAWKKNPGMLTEQANYKAYITQLEAIVNVGKHKRIYLL